MEEEFNPEEVKNRDFELKFDEPFYTNSGLLHQLKSPYQAINVDRKKVIAPVLEVGEYSLFIKKNFEGAIQVLIKTRNSLNWYKASEIISNPSGSILYFKERVDNIFKKGYIYPIIVDFPHVITMNDLINACNKLFQNKNL